MPQKLSLLTCLLLLSVSLYSQLRFSNRNDLLAERDLHSAVPVAIADMNGDGLDDIVAAHRGRNLFVQYQTPDPARPFVRYELPVTIANSEQNNISIADFNNDGANDIFMVGTYDLVKILYSIPFTYGFDFQTIMVTPFFSQGASTGDFNGDGWVDVVILNDNGLNYTMINDGAGGLVVDTLFNFVTVPASDNSGNYGCLFTDFDMDGDNDFYIAKCRQGVNNPTDPRRINVLHVNDGNNNYVEDAANYGLASGRQTWTADFGDIDNDGDLDVFMTQHDVISELYENINNDTFVNITATAGLDIGGIPLQGMFRDFDNDGFQDILVSGDRLDFYRNNGDKTFTRAEPFGNIVFGTFGLGDLNNDGFTDVYASRVMPFNNPDLLREDILFMNDGNENHFLSLRLMDPLQNSSAIGATAMLYGKWGVQIRHVRGGEQYGVSNSHVMIFGLGEETTYDSLLIRWPDGEVERYNELAADNNWILERGGCSKLPVKVWDFLDVICGSDSIILKIDEIEPPFQWSTGSDADSIIIHEPGLYYATFQDSLDCIVRTLPLEVIKDPDSIRPLIFYDGNLTLCNKETASLSLPFANGYQWSTGETGQSIQATETGDYFAEVQGYCITQISDTIHLDFLVPDPPMAETDTFLLGEPAQFIAHGDSIIWYEDPEGMSLLSTGPVLILNDLTESKTIYAANLGPIPGQEFQVGPADQQGNPKYNAAFINGGLLFEVYQPVILKEFTVYTDSAGTRIIEFSNGAGFFYEHQVDIPAGMTTIQFDLALPAGAYTVSTNTDLNNLVFGDNSPFLWRSSENVLYPYDINGVLSITSSTFGENFYYYFYDWKILTDDKYCESDLVPVTAFLDTEVDVTEPQETQLRIFPNPVVDITTVYFGGGKPVTLELLNSTGTLIARYWPVPGEELKKIDLTNYPAGIYLVRLTQEEQSIARKVIKL